MTFPTGTFFDPSGEAGESTRECGGTVESQKMLYNYLAEYPLILLWPSRFPGSRQLGNAGRHGTYDFEKDVPSRESLALLFPWRNAALGHGGRHGGHLEVGDDFGTSLRLSTISPESRWSMTRALVWFEDESPKLERKGGGLVLFYCCEISMTLRVKVSVES